MEEQQSILVENEIIFDHATTGLRFADYVIDTIAYYIVLIGLTLASIIITRDNNPLFSYLYVIAVIVGYYTLMEGFTGGKTIGKYITGTRVVKEDGSPITFQDALLRSLSRLVPFEPFSAFGGHPWHDRWTKTIVIKERR